jgi:uncharacterized cupredoxin-like copper-binding protein
MGCALRSGTMIDLRLPLTLTVLGLGAVGPAGCGNTSSAKSPDTTTAAAAAAPAKPASASGAVSVTLSEWKVTPTTTTVAHGPVTFDVRNAGAQPHEMVVLKTTKEAAALGKAGTARLPETGHVGEVGELKAGAGGKTTIHLKPGHYVLICNLPGHWTAGMRSDLTVK